MERRVNNSYQRTSSAIKQASDARTKWAEKSREATEAYKKWQGKYQKSKQMQKAFDEPGSNWHFSTDAAYSVFSSLVDAGNAYDEYEKLANEANALYQDVVVAEEAVNDASSEHKQNSENLKWIASDYAAAQQQAQKAAADYKKTPLGRIESAKATVSKGISFVKSLFKKSK